MFFHQPNQPMTIVMIGQKGVPARSGGIERHVELLAKGLASRGHRVVVFGRAAYVGGRLLRVPGVEERLSPGIRTKSFDALTHSITALWAARRERPDIVHIHGTGIALLTPLARVLHPNAKVIVTFHCIDRTLSKWGFIARMVFRAGEWLACHAAHRTIAVSQALTRYCMDTYGTQTTYIAHPFVMPEANFAEAQRLSSFGLEPERYFLFVGRLIPDKQAHVLVRAFARAKVERPDAMRGMKLAIVGGASWTDRYARVLCQLTSKDPDVLLLGEKTGADLVALQAHAFAHVFPTASEGLSVAIMEAGAHGRLIIATDIESNLEVTGGHMIPARSGDEASLARALETSLETARFDRDAMASRAKAHVKIAYDYDNRIDDMCVLYREVAEMATELVTPIVLEPASHNA